MNVALRNSEPVTPEEFEAMAKDERFNYELIDGVVMMSPRPAFGHQFISSNLISALSNALKGKACWPVQEVDLVVDKHYLVPDFMVICEDKETLREMKRYEKPPLIAIEIISPSSSSRDHITKKHNYETMGVMEYWVVSPEEKCITVFDFENDIHEMYCEGQVKSYVLPEICIDLADVFA